MADDNEPNPGTKAALEQENARLAADNERLRGQLAAAGTVAAGRAYAPAARFLLTEGERQELELNGVVNKNGRLMTRDEVLAALEQDQANVQIAEVDPARAATLPKIPDRGAPKYGVDFVYPSVAPGLIDPAVAGTPGVNGPPAGAEDTGV